MPRKCLIIEIYHSALDVGSMLLLIKFIRDMGIRFSTIICWVFQLDTLRIVQTFFSSFACKNVSLFYQIPSLSKQSGQICKFKLLPVHKQFRMQQNTCKRKPRVYYLVTSVWGKMMKYDVFNLKITQTAHYSMPADKITRASLRTTGLRWKTKKQSTIQKSCSFSFIRAVKSTLLWEFLKSTLLCHYPCWFRTIYNNTG